MGFGNGAIRGTGGTGAGKHTLEGPHVGHTGFAGYLGTFEGLSSVPFCSGAKCYYNIVSVRAYIVSVRACKIDVLSCILKYI